jgi:hypothetical protein
MPVAKQKLTLTVDAETVEAAKKLGLNISEVTERLLRGYTLDSEHLLEGVTREQYKDLLETMDPLLARYRCRVVVGSISSSQYEDEDDAVFYDSRSKLYTEAEVNDDQVEEETATFEEVTFLRPTEILKNFFSAIESVKSRRREEVEGIILAKRLVETLTEQESKRSPVRAATISKGGRPR